MVRAKPSMTKAFGSRSGRLRDVLALVAAWLLLAGETGSGVVSGGNFARPHFQGIDRLREWMDLARKHTPGTVDEPVDQVRTYPLSTLTQLQSDFEAYLEVWRDPGLSRPQRGRQYSEAERALLAQLAGTEITNGTGNALLRKIAMLHTDAMVLPGAETFLIPDTPNAGGEPVTMTSDGVGLGSARTSPLWPIARVAVGGILPDAKADPWVRRWYEATSSFLLYGSQLATLPGHLRERQALMPDDVGAVFDEACVYEAFAGDRVQLVAASERARKRDLAVPGRTEALSRAKRTFESVLARDAQHGEARLRLGRVLWGLGEIRRSADELVSLTQRSDISRELRYFALLFLGESRWSLGEAAPAADAYEAALALYPKAQSPVVGLLLARPRVTDDDRTAGERVLALRPMDRIDPWLNYHLGAGRSAHNQMEALWRAPLDREVLAR
jgi:tetratricopeptide (TPR) repeat protein